jgi:hypothetical protein
MQSFQDSMPDYMSQQTLGDDDDTVVVPGVDFVGYRTTPPPGWMLNWQGYSSFHGVFYRPSG